MVPEIWNGADLFFCHFRLFFPFYPSNNPENQNFEKMKKNTWRYYHFLHVTNIENHMMYGSWDIKCL